MGITKRARATKAAPDAEQSSTPGARDRHHESAIVPPPRSARTGMRLGELGPVLLWRAAHPRQSLLIAAGVTVAATLAGRSLGELGLVFATVLVGQAILGWHNDLVDRRVDTARQPDTKPLAQGLLDPGTVWFALTCAVLLLIPLSISNGVTAGSAYLLSVAVGLLANIVLRNGLLSWLPWAASFALLPAFLSYGGLGDSATGNPPTITMTLLAALLGIGAHVLVALPGLVADNAEGMRHLPLRLALKLGATRLLLLASAYTGAVVIAMLLVGRSAGLSQ